MLKNLFPQEVWYYGLFTEKMSGLHAGVGVLIYILLILGVIATAYLCGSVNSAVIISKAKYGEDIRTKGSHNGGMTNMMRTYGKGPAALTLLGDMLKALVGMIVGTLFLGLNGAYIAGFCCVLGHIAPIFYRFKGGKGVASTAMVVLYIDWKVFLILLIFFILIVWFFKYLSLGSILCEMFMPMLLHRNDELVTDRWLRLILALALGCVVIFMHRANIKRIMNGTESKFAFKKTVKTDAPQDTTDNDTDSDKKEN